MRQAGPLAIAPHGLGTTGPARFVQLLVLYERLHRADGRITIAEHPYKWS
jgi:hypothetical protein